MLPVADQTPEILLTNYKGIWTVLSVLAALPK